jgi:hypothetical protein
LDEHGMSDRRQYPPRPTPSRGIGAIPRVSGEYRIIVPRSAGRELDELDLDIIADGDGLELECMPSSHRLRVATPPPMLPPALAQREQSALRLVDARPPPGRSQSSSQHAIDPHAAIVAFAGFGDPPATVWGTPAYAMRVIERRRVLRAALFRARSLRSQDVGLYEAALEAADGPAVRKGIFIVLLTVAIVFAICAQLITDAVPLPW